VVGGGPAARLIADTVRRHPWAGVEVVGRVSGNPDDSTDTSDTSFAAKVPFLGAVEELAEIVAEPGHRAIVR
jgi:hypothetical protein